MKKWIAMLLAMALVLGMVGCGQTEKAEEPAQQVVEAPAAATEAAKEKEPVTIEFSSWYAAEETTAATMYAMVDAFMAKYPWITVNVTEYAYNNLAEQLLVRGAGGTAPDVSQVNAGWVAGLVEMDVLNSMNDIMPADVVADFYCNASVGSSICTCRSA